MNFASGFKAAGSAVVIAGLLVLGAGQMDIATAAPAPPDVTVTATITTTVPVTITATATIIGPTSTFTVTSTSTTTQTATVTSTATATGPTSTATVTDPTSTVTMSPSPTTTTPAPKTVPWRPTQMTVTRGRYSATVSWAPPVRNGGYRITGYKVGRNGRDTTGGGPYVTVLKASARSFHFTLLKRHTTYRFKVAAINQLGRGLYRFTTITTR
jgi:Fibronectin type III domain